MTTTHNLAYKKDADNNRVGFSCSCGKNYDLPPVAGRDPMIGNSIVLNEYFAHVKETNPPVE